MMEKEMNKQQLDKLIKDWTDELLASDIDDKITDNLIDFIEDEDTETDVNDLIDFHIHQLAIEESMTRRLKWRVLVSSVAAASVVMLIGTAIFISTLQHDPHTDKKTLAVENKAEAKPIALNIGQSVVIADSSNMQLANAIIKSKPKAPYNSNHKANHAEKAMKQKEETPELILTETLAEINTGLANMIDNTKECLRGTNVSLLPENLFSDINEYESSESISDEYSSTPHSEQMQKLNIIENNLINALYEIRSLNVDLNFNTDNITTEI